MLDGELAVRSKRAIKEFPCAARVAAAGYVTQPLWNARSTNAPVTMSCITKTVDAHKRNKPSEARKQPTVYPAPHLFHSFCKLVTITAVTLSRKRLPSRLSA